MSAGSRAARSEWKPRDEMRLIGGDINRVDAALKVTGKARYGQDVRLEGMAYAVLVQAPYPSGRVTDIDFEDAYAEGALEAISLLNDKGTVRYLGQPVAAVAADTPEAAEEAARAVKITMEEAGYVLDEASARSDGAPKVHRDGNVRARRERGDEAAAVDAIDGAAWAVEAEYEVPVQHHACLETHGCVVDYRGGDEATVYASTQAVHSAGREFARLLGLDAANVHVVTEHMGGGFGAKFSAGVEGLAAVRLAKELEQPVYLFATRKQEFTMAGNRSGGRQKLVGGMDDEGRIVGLTAEIARFGGLGRGANAGQPYIYDIENVYSDSYGVLTNTDAFRAMRAPGHPQASFAIESMIDELAQGLGLDSLDVRLKNLVDPEHGPIYHRQLKRVAREIGWYDHPHRTGPPEVGIDPVEGIGFGITTWGGGAARGGSQVDGLVESDGSVIARVATQDLGTGTRTYVQAIFAEELGLDVGDVRAAIGDSRFPASVGSGGSVTTPSLAPAVQDAACQLRDTLKERFAPLFDAEPEEVEFVAGSVRVKGRKGAGIRFREACRSLVGGVEVRGTHQPHLASSRIHGAQAARVRVDPLTGEVKVLKMVAIHDVGLPLNKLALRSQINGGMIQALSYGLLEERVLDTGLGVCLNPNFESYKIAGAEEIPELVAIIDDEDSRHAVIGMAESPVICGHSAIAGAVHNACGVRVRSLPITSDKILLGLQPA